MNITITIECETVSELGAHLMHLRRQVIKEAKRLKLDPLRDEFPEGAELNLSDDNCYGTHDVEIKYEN
jgi:hypothetical protein